MNIQETVLALAPAAGFVIGVAVVRGGRNLIGALLILASISVALVAVALDNARPVVGLLALGCSVAASFAAEKKREGLALACFSAALLVGIIAAMYT